MGMFDTHMGLIRDHIVLIYLGEVYSGDQPFNEEQQKWLDNKISELNLLKFSIGSILNDIKKIRIAGEEFEAKYKEWGGNTEPLEIKMKELRNANRKLAVPFLRG